MIPVDAQRNGDQIYVNVAGVRLGPFNTETEAEHGFGLHIIASVSEGMCPQCASRLDAERRCDRCACRWRVTDTSWHWERDVVAFHRYLAPSF